MSLAVIVTAAEGEPAGLLGAAEGLPGTAVGAPPDEQAAATRATADSARVATRRFTWVDLRVGAVDREMRTRRRWSQRRVIAGFAGFRPRRLPTRRTRASRRAGRARA